MRREASASSTRGEEQPPVAQAAAANGRIDAYLSHLADAFVFLGTDPRERRAPASLPVRSICTLAHIGWDRAAFEEYARGRFAAGDHWKYRVLGRNAFSPALGGAETFVTALPRRASRDGHHKF